MGYPMFGYYDMCEYRQEENVAFAVLSGAAVIVLASTNHHTKLHQHVKQ